MICLCVCVAVRECVCVCVCVCLALACYGQQNQDTNCGRIDPNKSVSILYADQSALSKSVLTLRKSAFEYPWPAV